jgi:2-polyprenyl-6-methoxyphenol hydroxylase-like FAD-dependent oxidoreductase
VILIIGGGIAGSAAALAAHKAGFDVAVFEGHPDSGEDIGAFLTLAGNGMTALAQCDAADAVARAGFALSSMHVLGHSGELIATAPLNGYRCLRRAELCRVLQQEVAHRGIPLQFGKRLESAGEDPDGVTARFADGTTARGELLIGADGLNSTVRSLLAPAALPRYAGQRVSYGYTTAARPPHEPERIVMVRGSAAAFGYTVSPGGETYWFARVHGKETPPAELSRPRWRDELVDLLRADTTPAADIVAATRGPVLATSARDLPGLRPWRTARMLLIGDAAHAASPATGQGASMAVEDAVVLAKALRDTTDPLAVYERVRRPRVEDNIATSARLTAGPTSQGPRRAAPAGEDELRGQLEWGIPLT